MAKFMSFAAVVLFTISAAAQLAADSCRRSPIIPPTERDGQGQTILRLLVGNPLIMKEMAKTVPDAAAYAPVTILVDERTDGVHLSYDSMASLIAPYSSPTALEVAQDLDTKIQNVLKTAAGVAEGRAALAA